MKQRNAQVCFLLLLLVFLPSTVAAQVLENNDYRRIRSQISDAGATDFQINNVLSSNKGKRVRWSGWVENVKADGLVLIDMDPPSELFSDSDVELIDLTRSSVAKLRKGEEITFTGRIVSLEEGGSLEVEIENASLVANDSAEMRSSREPSREALQGRTVQLEADWTTNPEAAVEEVGALLGAVKMFGGGDTTFTSNGNEKMLFPYERSDESKGYAVLDEVGSLSVIPKEFSPSTYVSDAELLANRDDESLAIFVAQDDRWRTVYFWNVAQNALHYVAAELETEEVSFSGGANDMQGFARLISVPPDALESLSANITQQ